MRDSHTIDSDLQYCPRDPGVETNLRCGRCDELICPRCLVNSPVGARCPACARVGRPAILDTSSSALAKALAAGVSTGVALGALLIAVLVLLDFVGLTPVNVVAKLAGLGAIGYATGEVVRRTAGYKLARKLQVVAGTSAFSAFITANILLNLFGNLNNTVLFDGVSYVGLGIGVYVAMGRVRP